MRYSKIRILIVMALSFLIASTSGCSIQDEPHITPTTTVTQKAMLYPTIHNTATTTATSTPIPCPDLSRASLTPPDLPVWFGMGPTGYIVNFLQEFSEEKLDIATAFYIEHLESWTFIYGGLYSLPDIYSQAVFASMLGSPETLIQALQLLVGDAPAIEQAGLGNLDDIGGASAGRSMLYRNRLSGMLRRSSIVLFQRGCAGALLLVSHYEDMDPVVTIDEVALILDAKIMDVLTSSGWLTTEMPSLTPSVTPSPTSTAFTPIPSTIQSPTSAAFIPMTPKPSRTPSGVIDQRPLDLILTLDELGLEDTYSFSHSRQYTNEEYLENMPSWEETQKWQEWLDASGRITGWYVWYESRELGYRERIGIEISIYRTTLGPLVSTPSWWNSPPDSYERELLRDLEIGDSNNAALHRISWIGNGVDLYQQYVRFSFRNIDVWLSYMTTGEPASEGELDWLIDISQMQLAKLHSMPLSDEFVGYW